MVRSNISKPFKTLGFLEKSERFTGKTRTKLLVKPVILVRIPPFSLVSPGCCIPFGVCAYGGIQDEGAPVVLTILLFQNYCRQYMCMEMEILLVF